MGFSIFLILMSSVQYPEKITLPDPDKRCRDCCQYIPQRVGSDDHF